MGFVSRIATIQYSYILLLFFFFTSSEVTAQTKIFGGGPYSFYKISFTPRETAMGGTGVASSTGPFSPFWNPANLITRSKDMEFDKFSIGVITRTNLYKPTMYYRHDIISQNFDFNSVALAYRPTKIRSMGFGISLTNKTYSGIEKTLLNINNEIVSDGFFDISELMSVFTAAMILEGTRVGVNFRGSYFSYPGVRKPLNMAGVDVGIQVDFAEYLKYLKSYQEFFEDFIFGMAIFFDKDDKNTSNTIVSGITLSTNIFDKYNILLRTNVDMVGGTFTEFAGKLGVEVGWKEMVFLRGGLDSHLISAVGGGLIVDIPNYPIKLKIDISYSIFYGFNNDYNYNLRLVDNPLKFGLEIFWTK